MKTRLSLFSCFLLLFLSCSVDKNPVAAKPELPGRDDSTFWFPMGTEGLDSALPGGTVELAAGDTLVLTASFVKKSINGKMERMLAYNGSLPGPYIRMQEGETTFVRFRNLSGMPLSFQATGGIRKPSSEGGVTGEHIADGAEATYRLAFPGPGIHWYHEGSRQDMTRALGLNGMIEVVPSDSQYWNPVDREVSLILSEVKIDSHGIVPFRKVAPDHAALGRFGTHYLINGDPDYLLTVRRNEYVRFHAVSAFNTRVIYLVMNKHWMKVIASDMGKYESSQLSAGEVLGRGSLSFFDLSHLG